MTPRWIIFFPPDASVRGSCERFIDFPKMYHYFWTNLVIHDQFAHKKVVSTGNVSKSDRAEKNLVIRGNVTKPEKSELDPPLAEGEMDDGATFFLYTHAPPTTHAP